MPVMDPDFTWGGIAATTQIYPKGEYELVIQRIRGSAWPKRDKSGEPTGEYTMVARLTPTIAGMYNSEGKLGQKLPDGGSLADSPEAEEINLWLHSKGGLKMAKQSLMAIFGYNPRDRSAEKDFNAWLVNSGIDLGFHLEERDDEGMNLVLHDGWNQLVGNTVRATMEPQIREVEGRDPVEQQNYISFAPLNQ